MCEQNSCGCSAQNAPSRLSIGMIDALRKKTESSRFQPKFEESDVRISMLNAGGVPALEVLSEKTSDKRSFLVFQRAGAFGGLDLQLKKFEIAYPKADVILLFKFDPFDDGVFKIEGTITIHCDDITKPGSCVVTIDFGNTAKELRPLINWDCLRNCAPQCISCGLDWQCWLGCAGACIIQCL